MKTLSKIAVAGLFLMGLTFTSCGKEDEITPGDPVQPLPPTVEQPLPPNAELPLPPQVDPHN